MSTLTPCPSCNRHVRVSDTACPFCGAAVVVAATSAIVVAPTSAALVAPTSVTGVPGRLGRAALFAAGATLMGMSACTDSTCAHVFCSTGVAGADGGGTAGTTGAGGTTGSAGSGGAAGKDAGIDAVSPADGPVAIYSAVFPPPEETKTGTAFAQTRTGNTTPRS